MLRIIIIGALLFALAGGTWQARGFFSPAPNSVQANLGAVNLSGALPESPVEVSLIAQSQPNVARYYYTVDVITDDQGDDNHSPELIGAMRVGEGWTQVFVDIRAGWWVIRVCAPSGRHKTFVREANALGDDLAAVKEHLNERVALAAVRESIVAQWNVERIAGSFDPLDILKVPRPC